jgi:hypothetical protein
MKLQIRIPSMMIRRDGLMAQPYPMAHNFVKLLSEETRSAPPTAGYAMNPLQQREAMQRELTEQKKVELLAKASGDGSSEDVYKVAKNWLRV